MAACTTPPEGPLTGAQPRMGVLMVLQCARALRFAVPAFCPSIALPRRNKMRRISNNRHHTTRQQACSTMLTLTPAPRTTSHPVAPPDCLWSTQRQLPRLRLSRPSPLSQTKISASEKPSTSSTRCPPLLRSPKELEFSLFDSFLHQNPEFDSHHQLPHRTGSAVLPLTEEESTKSRQTVQGSVCFRHRPP